MTGEEAKEFLINTSYKLGDMSVEYLSDKDGEKMREAIEAPEQQESILDKIRAEIEDLDRYYDNDYFSTNNCTMFKCADVLQMFDKYKAKSEEEG